jgi:hypothetical protein
MSSIKGEKRQPTPLLPGWIYLNTGEKITVEFEDHGQDFLEWDIVNDEVVDCRPFQGWVWKGSKILNLSTGPGDNLMIIPPKGDRMLMKEPIAKVKPKK